jgi:formylglycine-generating enzyme required for sulfatase activity
VGPPGEEDAGVDSGTEGGVDGGADAGSVEAGLVDGGVDGGSDSGVDGGDGGAEPPLAPGEWVLIPGGTFTMGSPESELGRDTDEGEHEVTLTRSFWMMVTEITQGQFEKAMEYNPSSFSSCGPTCPVEQVNWYEFAAYANALSRAEGLEECYYCTGSVPDVTCEQDGRFFGAATSIYDCAGYRLPTEAEWEYAARGGTTTATYNGDLTTTDCTLSSILDPAGWYCGNASSRTHPVGEKLANAYGLHDMLGNVWEWCHDWYGAYPGGAETDPTGPPSGSYRVLRGGSWNLNARSARAAIRKFSSPGIRG